MSELDNQQLDTDISFCSNTIYKRNKVAQYLGETKDYEKDYSHSGRTQ